MGMSRCRNEIGAFGGAPVGAGWLGERESAEMIVADFFIGKNIYFYPFSLSRSRFIGWKRFR